MTIKLSPDIRARLERSAAEGEYGSVDELITTLLDYQDDQLAELRAALQVGLDDIEAGREVAYSTEWWQAKLASVETAFQNGEFPKLVEDVLP